ncbi:hypothetical protein HY450_00040 [Candidatus Pacearchaeota archaeon]|nr:hypothetical protein [Candidatus Pacearchaeota archaeon]
MKKGDIEGIAQLLTAIKDGIEKLKEAQKNNDPEQMAMAKKEILLFHSKIEELL